MIFCGWMCRVPASYHISEHPLAGGSPMIPRRRVLESFAGWAAGYRLWAAARAAALEPTPRQTAGPFYPLEFPADSDNDLVQIAGHSGTAKGTVTYIGGRLLDSNGRAIPGLRVEIWQCDANGRYHYVHDSSADRPLDEDFQGYGQIMTDAAGGYRFRTIRPVPYPGRTPHIHFAVSGPGLPRFTTQMYVAGEPLNERDGVLMGVRDPAARARLIVPLHATVEPGALAGDFDIVLG
jgi:protocatechuate 3,4-dioxygenase beta subunit